MTPRRARQAGLSCGLTALVAAFLAGACATTTVRQHSAYSTRIREVRRVAVVPPEAQIELVRFQGDNERLRDEEQWVEAQLGALLVEILRGRGFGVERMKLDQAALAALPDLRFETTQIQGQFDQAMGEMYRSREMRVRPARSYQRSLGPEINHLAAQHDAEALVFVRFFEIRRSTGELAKDALIAALVFAATFGGLIFVPGDAGTGIVLSIVDADTGDVLWANTATQHLASGPDLPALVADVLAPFAGHRPDRIFGLKTGSSEAPTEVVRGLVSARANPYGRMVFTLDNDQVWRQIDDRPLRMEATEDQRVRIRRSPSGQFWLNVEGRGARVGVARVR